MWKQLSAENEGDWDRLSGSARDSNPFQSEAWGRYKRWFGWEPQHWIASADGGRVLCAVQVLKKPLPLGGIALWAPGGPLIGFPDATLEDLERAIPEGIREVCRANRAGYARFYILQPAAPETRRILSSLCVVPARRLGSGATVRIDLTLPPEKLLGGMEKKHRYLVRRQEENTLRWGWGTSAALAADLGRLHLEMAAAKRVSAAGGQELSGLIREFKNNSRILVGYAGGEPVTACLVLLHGDGAFYWRAAAGRRGREMSASYAMVWQLLNRLKEAGLQRFDFGGILPGMRRAAGINHFKQGFGGEIVEYLGEWEWAPASWIRWGVNLFGVRP